VLGEDSRTLQVTNLESTPTHFAAILRESYKQKFKSKTAILF